MTTKKTYLIMEGDDGGQIFLTIPKEMIKCSETKLNQILIELDEYCWPNNDDDMRLIYYSEQKLGDIIPGGMGGGKATKSLWVHPNIKNLEKKLLKQLTTTDKQL